MVKFAEDGDGRSNEIRYTWGDDFGGEIEGHIAGGLAAILGHPSWGRAGPRRPRPRPRLNAASLRRARRCTA